MTKNFKAILLNHSGLGVAEIAGRCAYESFKKSEHDIIRDMPIVLENPDAETFGTSLKKLHNIPSSDLLHSLSWVHHHESVIEAVTLQYHLTMSRGVLQETVRHRIASMTVKSTRYSMKSVIDAYFASDSDVSWFIAKIQSFNMFAYADEKLETIEIVTILHKLIHYDGKENKMLECLSNDAKFALRNRQENTQDELFDILSNCKAKRNAGDKIKFIVTDMWLTEMVWTINLRSLKNFLQLRNSGAAWQPMQHLAQQIEEATPLKYLRLISKKHKDK